MEAKPAGVYWDRLWPDNAGAVAVLYTGIAGGNEVKIDMLRDVVIFEGKESLSRDAAHRFISIGNERTGSGARFNVALAGGSTPEQLYRLLALPPFRNSMDWASVHFFFGDERMAPPDSPDSNFRMANAALFAPLAMPATNIHRMRGESADASDGARAYERDLRAHFALAPGAIPRFDLILLGMGPDGHTASLFPHKSALQETERIVVASEPGLQPFVPRLTLTLPVLNSAANVLFLVAGADKAGAYRKIAAGPADPDALPAGSVAPTDGTLTWLVDRAAAGIV